MSKTKQVYERFRDLLNDEFKIKAFGKSKHILGVRVEFVKNIISLSQRQYIEEIVRSFSFHSPPRKFLECEDENFDSHLRHQLIRSLRQLATWTKPDISLSVRRQWTFAPRVEHYLNNFQDSVDFLTSEQGRPVTNSPMLKAAEKSRSGSCVFFCDLVFFWK
jgi:hypothetical protein